MKGKILFFTLGICIFAHGAIADNDAVATRSMARGAAARYIDPQSYAYMYPYLSNQMRTELNPGTTVSMANNPIDVIVKTKEMSEPRRVVARPRTATNTTTTHSTTTGTTARTATNTNSNRRVVARTAMTAGTAPTARTATTNMRAAQRTTANNARTATETESPQTVTGGSNSQCLANYISCMEGYCERENMAYNRCYCSARLAQIDAKYQPAINDMMTQIVTLRAGSGANWTAEEMNEYWMERIGNYTGTNSWTNLDAALNIEWPTADERTRGQNAFLTGHEYCVQHLRACAYMSSNMRDAYRSKISRDCNTYENALIKIKTAAESMIEYYSE